MSVILITRACNNMEVITNDETIMSCLTQLDLLQHPAKLADPSSKISLGRGLRNQRKTINHITTAVITTTSKYLINEDKAIKKNFKTVTEMNHLK